MFGSAVIVFREVIEAALIISIVLAATKGVEKRGRWVAGGFATGICGALVIALLAGSINQLAEGVGQDLLNAIILFAAVCMLGWHNVWMRKHGAELARQMKKVGQDVLDGGQELYALALVVGLAVLREGAEVVLFMHGIAAGGADTWSMEMGAVLGVVSGSALGYVTYKGLLKIPTRHLFQVTGILILIMAAGMASQGAAFLVQADVLPALGYSIWDTTDFLSERSVFGNLLHVLLGYVSKPMGIQLIFYVVTIAIIGLLMRYIGKPPRRANAS